MTCGWQRCMRAGPAQAAGLSAGDLLLAIDGLRVTPLGLERLLCRRKSGDNVRVHAFRRDELMEVSVELGPPASDCHKLIRKGKANALRKRWLQGQRASPAAHSAAIDPPLPHDTT
jgi:predicted metalloprotease with PDZ domain